MLIFQFSPLDALFMLFCQNEQAQDLRPMKDMETFKNSALQVVKNTMTVRVEDSKYFCVHACF